MKWPRRAFTAWVIRFASPRPLTTSDRTASATMPTDPKMIATPATATKSVQSRPMSSRSRTSLKPTVVRVIPVM